MKRYLRVLRADVRNAVNLRFCFSVLLIPLLILMDSASDLKYAFTEDSQYSIYYFYMNSLMIGGLYGRYLVGMLCALPYATAFRDEVMMDIAPVVMARSGRRDYFLSKFIVNASVGGCVYFLGLLLTLVGLAVTGLPLFHSQNFQGMEDFFYMPLAATRPTAFFAISIYYAFWNGALLSGLAMWSSAYIKSRYAVFTVPAIALFAQIQMARVLKIPFEWQIHQWLVMRVTFFNEATTLWVAPLVVLLVLAACAWGFIHKGKKVMGCA